MIAERLILWHTYRNGLAFDLSENRNHGQLTDVALGSGPFSSALQFEGGDSAVRVKPSPSLTNLREVRAQVHFFWDPSAPNDRRHNLIEGHLAFAMFVNPDGSLQGTILNQLGSWEGATSAPGVVPTGEWHTAEFVHDGIGHCSLYLDGHVLAEGFSSPGPVRSVGPNGVAIGHWPEQPGQYTLEGYIDMVKVWCDDPVRDGGQLVDDCCIDRPRIAVNGERLRDMGLDSTSLGELVRGMFDVGRRAAYWITEGSSADRDRAYSLAGQLLTAYEHDDQSVMANAITSAAEMLGAKAPPSEIQDMWAQLQQMLGQLPGANEVLNNKADISRLDEWLQPWCLDGKVPPPPPPREPKRPRPEPSVDHSTDPDTDAPEGEQPSGWTEPGSHEDVPPPMPDTPPGGDGPGDLLPPDHRGRDGAGRPAKKALKKKAAPAKAPGTTKKVGAAVKKVAGVKKSAQKAAGIKKAGTPAKKLAGSKKASPVAKRTGGANKSAGGKKAAGAKKAAKKKSGGAAPAPGRTRRAPRRDR